MATAEEIAAFRLLISEEKDELPYSDAILGARLDSAASNESLAAQIWREKAATFAGLVSVSESGSSRQLSDLHANALKMAEHFVQADPTAPGSAAVRGTRMSRLTRS